MDSQNTYYIVAAIATSLGLLYKIGSVVSRTIVREFSNVKEGREKLRTIFLELTPNHGSSMKDKMNKMEQELTRNTKLTEQANNRIIITMGKLEMLYEDDEVARFECELPSGKLVWSNSAFQKMFGLTEAQVEGDGWLNALHPDDMEITYRKWMETISNWHPYKTRYRIIVGTTVKKVEAEAKVFRAENGTPISALGSVRVLSETEDTH